MFKSKNILANKNALKKLETMASGEWQCGGCKFTHRGLPDLGTTYPDVAGVPKEPELNSALRMEDSFLSKDFCILNGQHFFIRTVLKFPIQGRSEEFGFGVWSSLSRKNFDLYIESFDEGFPEGKEAHWTSWFMTNLNYFETSFKAKTWVVPQTNRKRPFVLFIEEDHPIYKLQNEGIEPRELLKIYDYYGCRLA